MYTLNGLGMYLLRGGTESLDDTDGALDDVVDLVGGGALEEEDIALAVARKVLAVSLAQNTQVGPCIPVGVQLEKAVVGPTSGPTWRFPHLCQTRRQSFAISSRHAREHDV